MSFWNLAGLSALAALSLLAACTTPKETGTGSSAGNASAEAADPYLWLEDVEGQKALDWVKAENAKTMAVIDTPRFRALKADALAILAAKDRIPAPTWRSGGIENFWQDGAHVKGLWRRASVKSYLSPEPQWDIILDVDALAKAEGISWFFRGANCLPPDNKRCMVRLTDGGKDAVHVREFDLKAKSFIADGFKLDEAKQGTEWLDKDTLLVARALTPDEETESGYARVVRKWKRGTPLASAPVVFTVDKRHVSAQVFSLEYGDDRVLVLTRALDFFTQEYEALDKSGGLHKLPIPNDAEIAGYFAGEVIVALKSNWSAGGADYPAGAYVSFPLKPVLEGKAAPALQLLFAPTETQAPQGIDVAKDAVYVTYLDNVRGRISAYRLKGGTWAGEPVALPELGAVEIAAASDSETRVFALYHDFLSSDRLISWEKRGAPPQTVKTLPQRFNADGLEVLQRHATSKDGTKIPYFLVRRKNATGPQPTMLYGYGGFELSYIPGQMPISHIIVGKLWVERGGQFAVANLRGGGEFGPTWHTRILKERRQDVFDDFAGVAQDLIATGATSSDKLGIIGGSNGGLLVGAAMTQHPELYKAVVIDRPLLDMLRYHKLLAGASWVAEYGNPDIPADREYIAKFSPYQN
ncbi:MAG: prolyl oligopeptidase family serine peptidase, partial [Alphaproteobacteria bacterium]